MTCCPRSPQKSPKQHKQATDIALLLPTIAPWEDPVVIALCYPPQLHGKTLMLKMPHTLAAERPEISLKPGNFLYGLPPYLHRGAMQASHDKRHQ